MGTLKFRQNIDGRAIQRLQDVDAAGNLLLGLWRTTTYTQPTLASATPVAWTTANSPVTIFTVTGSVICRVYGVVGATAFTSTGSTGTLALGISGTTGLFIAATTANGTNFIANSVWIDTAPTVLGKALPTLSATLNVLLANANIILTVATNSMTAGAVVVYCDWFPVSAGASVASVTAQ
jgi:hypothetical protein